MPAIFGRSRPIFVAQFGRLEISKSGTTKSHRHSVADHSAFAIFMHH
jgi:hypothetical protein